MTLNIRSLFSTRVKLHRQSAFAFMANEPAALSKVSGGLTPRILTHYTLCDNLASDLSVIGF